MQVHVPTSDIRPSSCDIRRPQLMLDHLHVQSLSDMLQESAAPSRCSDSCAEGQRRSAGMGQAPEQLLTLGGRRILEDR